MENTPSLWKTVRNESVFGTFKSLNRCVKNGPYTSDLPHRTGELVAAAMNSSGARLYMTSLVNQQPGDCASRADTSERSHCMVSSWGSTEGALAGHANSPCISLSYLAGRKRCSSRPQSEARAIAGYYAPYQPGKNEHRYYSCSTTGTAHHPARVFTSVLEVHRTFRSWRGWASGPSG
jgi:hypothetical protein